MGLQRHECAGAFILVPVTPASSTPAAPTAAAPPPPPSPNGNAWYNVVNVNSGLCADVSGWSTALGTKLDQWTCGNGQANQKWQFTPVGNGIYQVTSAFVASSWNVTGGGTTNGTPIQMWANGASNENWQAVYVSTDSNGNARYKFIAQNSGLCLDVPSASTTNGQQLDQFTCNGTNAQLFTLVQVNASSGNPATPTAAAPPAAPTPDGSQWYTVSNVGNGLCTDVFDFGKSLGTILDQWACANGQANQQWQFRPSGNGTYQVSSRSVAMSWNVTGGGTTNGTPIQLWSNGASNEQWQAVYLRTDGNGHNVYKFIAQNSGLCLDVPGASSANGQQLDEFASNGTNAQAFTLTPVTPAAGNPAQPTAPAATVPDAPSNSQAPNNNGQGTAPNNGQGTAPNSQPSPAVFRDSTAIHTIKNVNSGLCVDVLGGFTHSTLVQWPCNVQDDAQWWQFYAGPNFANYTIADPLVNNNVWDVAGGPQVTWNQAGIDVWDFNQQTNQKWAIYPQGNNMFTFVAVNSGKCLDVPFSSKGGRGAIGPI